MRTFAVSSFFELLGATATVAALRAELREELIAYDGRRRRMRLDWLEERDRAAVSVVAEVQSPRTPGWSVRSAGSVACCGTDAGVVEVVVALLIRH